MIDGWINYIEDSSALDLQSWSAQPSKYASIELFMYIPIYIFIYIYVYCIITWSANRLEKEHFGVAMGCHGLAIALLETDIDTIPSPKANYENTSISI